MTGSTAYKALGFRGFKSVREHFKQFIYNKEPSPFPAKIQKRLNYERIHEVRKMCMLHKFIIEMSEIKFPCILSHWEMCILITVKVFTEMKSHTYNSVIF